MKQHLTLKRKEILSYATWVNLEDTALSEISQSQQDTFCMIPLLSGKVITLIETERW